MPGSVSRYGARAAPDISEAPPGQDGSPRHPKGAVVSASLPALAAEARLPALKLPPNRKFVDRRRYDSLMDVLLRRITARRFDPDQPVCEEDYRLILDAARQAPSGANAQPWQFIAITNDWTRQRIADSLVSEAARRASGGQRAEGPDYRALETAPGLLAVVADFRLSWAFSGLMAGSELDQRYHATAERVILQSAACATMAAHLAAASLGYQSWWISVLGQDDTQADLHALLGVPDDLTITDLIAFGHSAEPLRRRWKKSIADILSWNRFDLANFRSVAQIDAWMADLRQKVLRK
jgi:nitroreductase